MATKTISVDTTDLLSGDAIINRGDISTPIFDLKSAVEAALNGSQDFDTMLLGGVTSTYRNGLSTVGTMVRNSTHNMLEYRRSATQWSPFGGNVGGMVYGNAGQVISNATDALVVFDHTETDDLGLFNATRDTATIPSDLSSGYWLLSVTLHYDTNATGVRMIRTALNGNAFIGPQISYAASPNFQTRISMSVIMYLSPGDTLQIYANQQSGGDLNLTNENRNTFALMKI